MAIDVAVFIHFIFIMFVIFGALLAWKWPAVKWAHWIAMGYGLLIEIFNWYCPLTLLENHLRALAGLSTYDDSFIAREFRRLIYIDVRQSSLIAGALLVILLNATFYLHLARTRSRA